MDAFIESMQDLKMMRPTEISEILKRRSGTNIEMQNIVKMILKNGKTIIIVLFDVFNYLSINSCWSHVCHEIVRGLNMRLNVKLSSTI